MSKVGQILNKVRSVSLLDNRNWPVKRDGLYLTWWVEITGNKSPARGGSVDNPFDVSFTPCFSRIDGPVKEILILRAFDRFSVLRQAANGYFSEKPHVSWMPMGMEIRSSRIIHQHTARRLCHSHRRNTWHTRGFRDRYALCLGKNIHEDGTASQSSYPRASNSGGRDCRENDPEAVRVKLCVECSRYNVSF